MSSPGPGRRCWAARRRTACWRCRRARWSGCETYKPAWPLPKIFRLTKGGKLIEGIFKGETINTPSHALRRGCAGRAALGRERRRPAGADRAQRGQSRRRRRLGRAHATGPTSWPKIPATRSCTSICLKITAPWFTALAADAQAEAAKQHRRAAGEGRRRLRHRRLSRCAAGPAHLGRRDGRDRRHRGAAALARLGRMRRSRRAQTPRRRRRSERACRKS